MSIAAGKLTASTRRGLLTVRRRLRAVAGDASAALMIETVAAVTALVMVAVAALVGVSTTHTARAKLERQSLAENVARNQMAYVFSLAYEPPPLVGTASYPSVTSTPPGYSVTGVAKVIEDGNTDTDIERITVRVTQGGEEILVLETMRANH